MQRVSSRFSRNLAFSVLSTTVIQLRTLTTRSVSPTLQTLHQQEPTIPSHFLKWCSLGFVRTSRFATGFTPLQPKPLDSIMDIERAKGKSPEDLASIWDDVMYPILHSFLDLSLGKRSYWCVYDSQTLSFVGGKEQLIVQMPHMLFTGLEDYKARGTQAAPYFTVSFYTEFAETKDLVLIRGDVIFTSKLSDEEATWLLETAQSFYLNDVRYKLVERFNKETRDFEFKDVLRALDMPIL
ncbi:hypothetical protein GH714_025393 [Hevea brasiliensis]|uniref:ATP synthase mitochondrial F1 complex assembly factor 1 n=1 Tax=Hevea brasiliensis TaxID=3981 RepID=A0A6A6LVB2_HEVBR|nr:hypothetical protein GH714_025393 [Hevea brasiliensis]